MKIYHGERTPNGVKVRVSVNGVECALPDKLGLRKHSPDGFEWGYGGSGPAQLALAICANALHDDAKAMRVYQAFKWRVIAGIKADAWRFTEREVLDHIKACEAELAGAQGGQIFPAVVCFVAVIILSAAAVGVYRHENPEDDGETLAAVGGVAASIQRHLVEAEIETNEAECQKEARPGMIPYVVSRNGLLRGCLLVPEMVDPRGINRHLFVWKEPPL